MPKPAFLIPVLVSVALGTAAIGGADSVHVSADTTVSEDDPNSAFGATASINVRDTGTYRVHGYVRFDLSPFLNVPAGTPVARATLRIWVGSHLTDGYVAVLPVLGGWDERTLTWNTAPSLGSSLTNVKVTRDDALRYVTLDVTPLVQDWLDGALPNEGLALLPDSGGVDLEFDSKESTSTSHPMELEVVMRDADSGGDITAVNTPAGGGLQGGAASGGANLSLLTGCAAGQILKWTGSAWACAADNGATSGSGWSLTGNAGTTPGANFLGTTDNQALELRVNGNRGLRIEPNASSPNVIGGFAGNTVAPNIYGVVIGGGGESSSGPNRVHQIFGTIGGGRNNVVTRPDATIGGGWGNRGDADSGTIGGGRENTTTAGSMSTIAGGYRNTAGFNSSIGGGMDNVTGPWAAVAGGQENSAIGHSGFIGGGLHNNASGDFGTIPGGY